MEEKLKMLLSIVMNVFLSILAILILIYMGLDLVNIFKLIFIQNKMGSIDTIADYILGFFMLFEFIMMILRYIQEGHHIPIRYLILICLTAILRQLMVAHGDGLQTLLLSLSILLLVVVLFILGLNGSKFYTLGKAKVEEDHEQDFHH